MQQIDGIILRNMLLNAARYLDNNKRAVDTLNVFPVPDGDTGTNMSLTIQAAANELKRTSHPSLEKIAHLIAMESLKGARGNSGVILSQLFRGFAMSVKGYGSIGTEELSKAMKNGVDLAYRAVRKPTEGTILTVARESAEKALAAAKKSSSIIEVLEAAYKQGEAALARTPELLPVLKQAGVVDAGGRGYLYILEGAIRAAKGEIIAPEIPQEEKQTGTPGAQIKPEEIHFTYCTEFLIMRKQQDGKKTGNVGHFKEVLYRIGDCVIVIDADDVIKVHIHTNHPGKVLEEAAAFGELSKIKIDNMKEQHRSILDTIQDAAPGISSNTALNAVSDSISPDSVSPDSVHDQLPRPIQPDRKFSVIAVASGKGMEEIMQNLGVDQVVSGGQSMNPSTDDILQAINKVPGEHVMVFPNNGNIILAANQARELSGKNVMVIPSKTVTQGVGAIINLDFKQSMEENEKSILEAIARTKSGQVTFAVRDSNFDGLTIKEGDILGIQEGKIKITGPDIGQVTRELLASMVTEDNYIISIFYGEGITEEQANEIASYASSEFDFCDVEVHYGGQPIYYYFIGVE